MLFFFCQTLQSATIALTLLSLSFMHHVQCSGQNAAETGALNNHLTHPVQRQTTVIEYTVTDTDFRCDKLENDAYCGSGLAQSQVDNELACGTALNKVNMRPECLKNEKGEFCGSIFTRTSAIAGVSVCFDAMDFISDKINCSKCREQLETIKKELGCCLSAYVNVTYRNNPRFLFLDYSLWKSCGVCSAS